VWLFGRCWLPFPLAIASDHGFPASPWLHRVIFKSFPELRDCSKIAHFAPFVVALHRVNPAVGIWVVRCVSTSRCICRRFCFFTMLCKSTWRAFQHRQVPVYDSNRLFHPILSGTPSVRAFCSGRRQSEPKLRVGF